MDPFDGRKPNPEALKAADPHGILDSILTGGRANAPAPIQLEMITRDSDHDRALILYFDRVPTDAEMREIHHLVQKHQREEERLHEIVNRKVKVGEDIAEMARRVNDQNPKP